jgi:hypothetical protein
LGLDRVFGCPTVEKSLCRLALVNGGIVVVASDSDYLSRKGWFLADLEITSEAVYSGTACASCKKCRSFDFAAEAAALRMTNVWEALKLSRKGRGEGGEAGVGCCDVSVSG